MPRIIKCLRAEVIYEMGTTVMAADAYDFYYEGFFARWVEKVKHEPNTTEEVVIYVPYDRIRKITVR